MKLATTEEIIDEIIDSRKYHMEEAIRQAEKTVHEWEKEFVNEGSTIALAVRKKRGF